MRQEQLNNKLPEPLINRLCEYLLILENLTESTTKISSRELSLIYGNNANQVRQDFFQLDGLISNSNGYDKQNLIDIISNTLNLNKNKNVCIIGAGKLGSTIGSHVPFHKYGMTLTAIFDTSEHLIGKKINNITIQNIAGIKNIINKNNIEIATLCVPDKYAQEVCNNFIETSIKAVLNFSRIKLNLPDNITIKNQQIICSFMNLSHYIL